MAKKKFKRQEWWKYKRFKNNIKWRRPRGPKNPIRRKEWGRPPVPEIGYRKPRNERGLHPTGKVEVLVHNPKELEALKPEKHIVRIGSSVGKRKRMLIYEKAKELGLEVINFEPEPAEKVSG